MRDRHPARARRNRSQLGQATATVSRSSVAARERRISARRAGSGGEASASQALARPGGRDSGFEGGAWRPVARQAWGSATSQASNSWVATPSTAWGRRVARSAGRSSERDGSPSASGKTTGAETQRFLEQDGLLGQDARRGQEPAAEQVGGAEVVVQQRLAGLWLMGADRADKLARALRDEGDGEAHRRPDTPPSPPDSQASPRRSSKVCR